MPTGCRDRLQLPSRHVTAGPGGTPAGSYDGANIALGRKARN